MALANTYPLKMEPVSKLKYDMHKIQAILSGILFVPMDMVNFMSPRLFVTLHFLTFLVTLVPLRQCKQRWYGSSSFELNWQEAAVHIFFIYPDILLWDGKFLGSVGFAHCIHLVKQPRGNIWKAMVPLKTWTNQIFFSASYWCKGRNFSQSIAKVPPTASFSSFFFCSL